MKLFCHIRDTRDNYNVALCYRLNQSYLSLSSLSRKRLIDSTNRFAWVTVDPSGFFGPSNVDGNHARLPLVAWLWWRPPWLCTCRHAFVNLSGRPFVLIWRQWKSDIHFNNLCAQHSERNRWSIAFNGNAPLLLFTDADHQTSSIHVLLPVDCQ